MNLVILEKGDDAMNNNNKNNNNRYGRRVFAKGLTVSDDSRITGLNANDIIVGGTGAGKTGSVIIPTMQNIESSLVVSDTKGLLEKRFRKDFISRGFKVYTLDFVNPEKSCGYNPLNFVRKNKDGSYRQQDIIALANTLVPTNMDSSEPFWEQSAAAELAFHIAYCLESQPEEKKNLKTVFEINQRLMETSAEEDPDYEMIMWLAENPDSFAASKYREIKSNSKADKMQASIQGFINVALEPFSYIESEYLYCNKNSFDIGSLGKEKTVLFINVSDTDSTCDRAINIFYSQALNLLCSQADENPDGKLDVPVRFILDDFAASAKIDNFDRITSVIRSRDIFVTIVLQSLTQLDSVYGEKLAKTIINNCDHMLYMSGQDVDTIKFIAERAHKTPENIQIMPRNKAYFMENGAKARLVDKIVPYSTVSDYQKPSTDQSYAGNKEGREVSP